MHPLIENQQVFVGAGVWDALSARVAERAGFRSVVLSGYAVAASYLGEPDFGLLTQSEILDVARRVCRAVECGVIVDGDNGGGNALNTIRLVEELVQMGARGVILEDQTWPKRCGHMRGKSVIPAEEHAQKIRAAVEAKGDAPFVVTARTDARGPEGLDEAIRRGKLYKEAGATFIFIEAPKSVDEIKRIAKEVPGPLVINNIEGGDTPILSLEELQELGFLSVGFVLTGLFSATKAMDEAYQHLLEHGTSKGLEDRMIDFRAFADIIGLEEKYRLDERYATE